MRSKYNNNVTNERDFHFCCFNVCLDAPIICFVSHLSTLSIGLLYMVLSTDEWSTCVSFAYLQFLAPFLKPSLCWPQASSALSATSLPQARTATRKIKFRLVGYFEGEIYSEPQLWSYKSLWTTFATLYLFLRIRKVKILCVVSQILSQEFIIKNNSNIGQPEAVRTFVTKY